MGAKPIATAAVLAMGFGVLWAGTVPAIAPAAAAAAAAEGQPKAASGEPGRRVCRNLIRSGTRLTTRYCRTQAEWDESGESARRLVQDGQNEGNSRDGEFAGTGTGTGSGRSASLTSWRGSRRPRARAPL